MSTTESRASFERGDRDGERVLVVTGEIDLATAPQFRRELEALRREARSPGIADLSGVTFLDSSGISALVAASAAVAGTSVRLVLANPSPPVRRVLEISGVDRLFEIRTEQPADAS